MGEYCRERYRSVEVDDIVRWRLTISFGSGQRYHWREFSPILRQDNQVLRQDNQVLRMNGLLLGQKR